MASISFRGERQRPERYGLKALSGLGESDSSGSFTAFRMTQEPATAKTPDTDSTYVDSLYGFTLNLRRLGVR
jgi:hypothetical protein